ncbi:MAG TPA: RHS repeat-associated core domain-containing protein [Thermoanaerobaculia bacterium]|nr:RHS repeat-associated core domain-containing protein [Thermoanaerobaculia bacterium]
MLRANPVTISNRILLRLPSRLRAVAAAALALSLLVSSPASSAEIAKADLEIRGSASSLTVVTISATTGIDIPVAIQTAFGGKQNDEAPLVEGLTAVAELTGPGLESPIRLETAPGRQFQIPGLSREGNYLLQNIRLMRGAEFLQSATPAVVSIAVANVLQTKVRVRQLSPEELRARGITVDARNFDTFEYTFSFFVNGQTVEIPYFVNIDRTTRAVLPVANETPYALPPITAVKPPRWTPPTAIPTELVEDVPYTPRPPDVEASGRPQFRPSIPAALIIPSSIGVLHQFRAGASENPLRDGHGGLLKQIIHGGLSYDDPIEVTSVDGAVTIAPGVTPPLTRLYPIYDEVGAGDLQLVLNQNAEIVARSVPNDPYGADTLSLSGAAADRIAVVGKKNDTGELTVEVSLRTTETLAASSIATGVRLATLDATGALVRKSAVEPQIDPANPSTIRWTLTYAEWQSLITVSPSGTEPNLLSIAATNTLRAAAWGAEVPILPAPDWAAATQPVYSSAALPIEARATLASLATFLAGIPTATTKTLTLYEVEGLPLLASAGGDHDIDSLLTATFHAHPMSSRLGQLDYVRARWLHRTTGTWLSPDPEGYRDSSNLYAFGGGDPVNGRDPSGEARRTKNGGMNWFGDWGDETDDGVGAIAIAKNTIGNTLSDLLMLDAWADANVVLGDSSRSGNERSIAAAKAGGIAALNLVGGEIVGTAGKALLKVPGAKNLVGKLGETKVAQVLATDVGSLLTKRSVQAANVADNAVASLADDTILTPWGTRSRSTGKFVVGERSGLDPVEDFIVQAEANGFEVLGREISFKTPFETRRIDVVLRNQATGQVGGVEIKSSLAEFSKLKKEQFAADRFINQRGATAVGENARQAGIKRIDSVMKILWER